jgi:hypothetical protein
MKREVSQRNLSQTNHNKSNNKSKSPIITKNNQSPLNKAGLSKGKYESKPIRSISPKPNKNK